MGEGWTVSVGDDEPQRSRVYEVRTPASDRAESVTQFDASGVIESQDDIERAVTHLRGILGNATGQYVRLTIRVVG